MDAAARAAAPGQGDVERFLGEARRELRIGELGAARLERLLYALLGRVVGGAGRALFLGRIAGRAKSGKLSALAEEARLCVLEGRGIARRAECGERAVNDARERANGSGWP
jgi:hypothetical protein